MSVKVEYLEKYSVAPPPSRDYYGIKVLRDEVILFVWKISHGPHRAPTIKVAKFSEFNEDKTLQDEVQRVFGIYVLDHVKNIARNKADSILTFPKNVIAKISKYLKIKDIINLTTLSRASKEVFDNEVVWKTLYKKYKRSKITKEEKKYAMTSSWKQLLKERQIQESIKKNKSLEDKNFEQKVKERSSAINITTNQRNPNASTFSKKVDDSKKILNTEPSSRLNTLSKIVPEKKKLNLKSTTSMTQLADTNKLLPTNKLKIDSKEKEVNRSQLTINRNLSQKINSLTKPKSGVTLKSNEDVKTRKSSTKILETKKSNQALRNQKLVPEKSKLDSKTQKKQVKANKIGESKSTILNRDKTLFNDLQIDDISSLIEESLKNFKSPRSIFNYDFSILDDKKSAGDSKIASSGSEIQIFKKDLPYLECDLNSSARSNTQSDDEKLDMAPCTQKYLDAQAEFMKKMSEASNLSALKNQGSKSSCVDDKFPKSLITIPENLRKARGSFFATQGIEGKNISQDKFKMQEKSVS
ncbi:uncharacterized protein LOC117181686 [Belonocnema kinseyi]|uniref:uncharacterized protein LOC117181686 n=1 Tax=Belonocnema kinseyi TaxID=2817044 RepID=UPI00143D8039|nr:uncharacterized protein LOC117181686 [Belonocnema kinseyi]